MKDLTRAFHDPVLCASCPTFWEISCNWYYLWRIPAVVGSFLKRNALAAVRPWESFKQLIIGFVMEGPCKWICHCLPEIRC